MAKVNAKRIQNFLKKCDRNNLKRSTLGLSLIVALSSLPKISSANDKVNDKNENKKELRANNIRTDNNDTAKFYNGKITVSKVEEQSVKSYVDDTDAGIYLIRRNNKWFIGVKKERLSGNVNTNAFDLNYLGLALLKAIDPQAYQTLKDPKAIQNAYLNNDLYLDYQSSIEIKASFIDSDEKAKYAYGAYCRRMIDYVVGGEYYKYDNYKKLIDSERSNRVAINVYRSIGYNGFNDYANNGKGRQINSLAEFNDKAKKFRDGVNDVDDFLDQVDNTLDNFSKTLRTIKDIGR